MIFSFFLGFFGCFFGFFVFDWDRGGFHLGFIDKADDKEDDEADDKEVDCCLDKVSVVYCSGFDSFDVGGDGEL